MRDGWALTTFGEIAAWSSGKFLPLGERRDDGAYPVHGANGVIGRADKYLYDQPIVTVGRVGAIGEVHRVDGKVWVSDNALVARAGPRVGPAYLALLLEAFEFATIKGGSTQPLITQGDLVRATVSLPSIEEQRRISDLTEAFDAALGRARDEERAARRALAAYLVEETAYREGRRARISQVVSSSIGGDWGGDPGTSDVDLPVYRQTEFTEDGLLARPAGATRSLSSSKAARRQLAADDILLQKSAGTPSLPGRVVRVPPDIERSAFSNFLHLLRPDPMFCDPAYLFWFLWSEHRRGVALAFQAGTNIRNLSVPAYLGREHAFPPIEEQRRVGAVADAFQEVLIQASAACQILASARASIIEGLLSGEHEIPGSYDRFLGGAE